MGRVCFERGDLSMKSQLERRVLLEKDGTYYYLLKIIRRGFDVYCTMPDLDIHHSHHESGESHFRFQHSGRQTGQEPRIVLQTGEAGELIQDGVVSVALRGLGRAAGIIWATIVIDSPDADFRVFQRTLDHCFVIPCSKIAKSEILEIGIWAVPSRNEVSFHRNNPDVDSDLLFKISDDEPQIWLFARPY